MKNEISNFCKIHKFSKLFSNEDLALDLYLHNERLKDIAFLTDIDNFLNYKFPNWTSKERVQIFLLFINYLPLEFRSYFKRYFSKKE